MVYNNGLISALVFIKEKEKKIYDHIKEWLTSDNYNYYFQNEDNANLIEKLINYPMEQLLLITDEVIRLADVLKLFSNAEL